MQFFSLFRTIINLLIIGNAICLAIGYDSLEWFFLATFILEVILKMYAMGAKEYFRHRWNIFDFTIILVSTTYSILTSAVSTCKKMLKYYETSCSKFCFLFLFKWFLIDKFLIQSWLYEYYVLLNLLGMLKDSKLFLERFQKWYRHY